MNGPDLRFLAERASALEDRTHERLVEVHGRIAVARERRRTGAALGAAGLVVALVVGLAVVQRGQNRNSPDPAPKPTTTATVGSDAAPPPPETGTCWAVALELAVGHEFSYDDSRQVPCSQPHTTETVGTFALDEPTRDAAEPTRGTCGALVGDYVGIDDDNWILAGVTMFLPSREQVADGASWVRCDAAFEDAWNPYEPADRSRIMTGSSAGLAPHAPAYLRPCLAQPPTKIQPLVSCDEPHAYEATGTLAAIPSGFGTYPSADELRAEEQQQCGADVPTRLAGASVTALWDREQDFDSRLPTRGICFMFHQDGTQLPPR